MLSAEVQKMRMLKVDDETYNKVCALADASHVSRADLIKEAIEASAEHDAWVKRAVGQAVAQVEDGKTVSHGEAIKHIDDIIDNLEKQVTSEH